MKKNPEAFSRRKMLGMALAVPLSLKGAVPLFQSKGGVPLFRDSNYKVVVEDLEGSEVRAGQSLQLEAFMNASGPDPPQLLAAVASGLAQRHQPLKVSKPPAGWCSWYCFGAQVTARQVLDNLDVIAKTIP